MTEVEISLLRKILTLGHRLEKNNLQNNLLEMDLELSQIQALLLELESSQDESVRRLSAITDHLHPGMTLKSFLDFLVPIERLLGKTVQDDDFLVHEADKDANSRTGLAAQKIPLYIVLDNIRSAFNVGSIFRAAECVGASEILLCGYTATPNDPSVEKTALGTEKWIKFQSFRQTRDALDYVKNLGAQVIGLETSNKSKDLFHMDLKKATAFLLGNERFGLDAELLKACDHIAAIPMFGYKNSLNVANATSIALFETRRQWSSK